MMMRLPPMRLLVLIAAASLAAPAHAELSEVQAHLRAVRTMTADFVQTAQGGQSLRGRMTLARPGKVRFQYDDPKTLVVGDGKSLALIDYRVNQVSRWPIRNTPLGVLLDPDVGDLARYARELTTAEGGVPGLVTVQAKDPKHREYGVTTLYFRREAGAPGGLSLQGWRVLDAQGRTTQVQLSTVRFNAPVEPSAFTFRDPRPRMNARPRG
jgi:outer membrane lipoprotein-sorting protein